MSSLAGAVEIQSDIAREDLEQVLRSLTVKRWLRTNELALYLGTTTEAIKKLKLRRKINPKKFEGRNYYDRLEIDRRIESSGLEQPSKDRRVRWR